MKKLIAGFAILASIAPTSFAFAAEPTAPTPATETFVAACETNVANIPSFLADMESRHSTNSAKLQTGIDRLSAFMTKAQEAGSDITALEANFETLVTYQASIEEDYAAIIAHLTTVQTLVCSEDTLDEWKANRETTKTYFDSLKATVSEIKTLRSEIKANMQVILDSIASSATATE